MRQINKKRSLQLCVRYFLLCGFLVAEPIFLKLLFQIYLPDFCYRLLTVPLSAIFGIASIKQWRIYQSSCSPAGKIKPQQLSFKNIIQQPVASISTIRQAVLSFCQVYKYMGEEFWKGVKFRYQLWSKVLVSVFSWKPVSPKLEPQLPYQNPDHNKKIATEPMALVWRNRSYRYCLWAELYQLLLIIYIPVSFWQNIPRWGLYDTSLTFIWEALLIFLCICQFNVPTINATKRQQLANQSGEDLLKLSETLHSLRIEGWQFEYRVILSQTKNSSRWQKFGLESLFSRLLHLQKRQQDIDVLAISPDGYYFIIELKSHVGEVLWDSDKQALYRRQGKDKNPLPFKEGNLLSKIQAQAKRLKKQKNLSQLPERILVFWQARVRIPENDRIKRGVLISNQSRLIRDLIKRNNQLVKKKGKHTVRRE